MAAGGTAVVTGDRLRVLFVSEMTARPTSDGIRIPDGHRRRYGGWSDRFDMTWTLTERLDEGFHAGRLPAGVAPLWLPGFGSAGQWLRTLPRVVRQLWGAMDDHDVVVVNAPSFAAVPALLVARLRRIPTLTLQLSRWAQLRPHPGRPAPLVDAVLGLVGQLVVLLSRRTYVAGEALHRQLWGPVASRATPMVYPAIGEADLQAAPAAGSRADGGRMHLLTVGRFIDTKRLDAVLATTAELRRRGVDACVTVVGDGVERKALEALVDELGLREHTTMPGWMDDWDELCALYRRADVFVFASTDEGLPLVIMEAMAFGLPIVTTPAGGLDTFLAPEADALVVPSPDPVQLADAIERLRDDPDLRRRLVATARDHVKPLTREAWLDRFDADLRTLVPSATSPRVLP